MYFQDTDLCQIEGYMLCRPTSNNSKQRRYNASTPGDTGSTNQHVVNSCSEI